MRNMKKISVLVLAASVVLGLLSGCGQSASGTTAAKAAATTAKSAAAATTAAVAKTTAAAAKTTAAAAKTTSAAKTATTAAKSGTRKLTKVTLSAQPAAHSLGIYAAKEKGWFEEEGLDVEILSYISGSPQLEAVASNAWTVGIMGPPAGITGSLKNGLTIVGFSVWDQPSQRLFVRKDSDIAKAGTGKVEKYPKIYGTADMWKGKNIICTKGSLGHLQLLATLKALGLKETDVNIIHMDMAAGYQAFLAGQGDAICTWSTFTSDALAAGYVQASSAEDAGLKAPSMVTASEKAMADPELTQKIINVIFRGTMWANENKDEAAKIYYDVCQEEGVTCTMEYAKQYLSEHSAPTIAEYKKMNENKEFKAILQNVMDYFIQAGTYTQSDAEKVVAAYNGDMWMKAIDYYEKNYANKK